MQRRQMTYSSHPNHRARAVHAQGERQFRTYDTSRIRPRKSKAPMVFAIVLLAIVLGVGGFFAFSALKGCSGSSVSGDEVVVTADIKVTVPKGSSASDIAATLESSGVVPDAQAFLARAKERSLDSQFKAGTYSFTAGMTLDEVIDTIVKGAADTGNLSIPEGYKLTDIAAAVESATQGAVTADDFVAAASDASVYAADFPFLESAGTNSLEGFLFPKTYSVDENATADSVIRMMLSQFQTEISGLDFSYPESVGLSLYDAVNLASIVERESTGDFANRAGVAGVFYNRLNTDGEPCYGYLQSDATTIYETGHDLTREELAVAIHEDTPYSTYARQGLPPTPICSPSFDCLKAVCNPEQSDCFFFYFDSDGVCHFSVTLEEHNAAIAG